MTSRRGIAFGVVLAGALALRLVCFGGLRGWDDVDYIEAARALRAHDYAPVSSFRLRYTVTIPLAVLQAWLGEGEWVQMLVPLGYSFAHLALAYALGSLAGGASLGLLAMALLAIVPLDVMAATDLHADLAASAFMAAAVYAMERARAGPRGDRAWLLASGVALGVAALAKESALALVAVLAIRAWRGRRDLSPARHGWLALGLLGVLALDAVWLGAVAGDPLHRVRGGVAPHVSIILRDTPGYAWMLEYPVALLSPLDGSFGYLAGLFYLVIAGTVWGLGRGRRAVVDATLWWLPLLLIFNFAPLDSSFTRPLFYHFARTLHPLLIPFVLTTAVWFRFGLAGRRVTRAVLAGGFAGLAAIGIWATTADHRSPALVARAAAPLVARYPADVVVLTDNSSSQLLRFLLPQRRQGVVRYAWDLPPRGGFLVLHDPLFSGVEAEAGIAQPRELAAPPSTWTAVGTWERPQRPSVRGVLRRLVAGESPRPAPPRAVLWWVPPA